MNELLLNFLPERNQSINNKSTILLKMAFNFLQRLTTQRQNTNDEGFPVDEFDYNSEEIDIELDHDELEEVGDDIDSPSELLSPRSRSE